MKANVDYVDGDLSEICRRSIEAQSFEEYIYFVNEELHCEDVFYSNLTENDSIIHEDWW